MSKITIDTEGNETLQRQARRLGLERHGAEEGPGSAGFQPAAECAEDSGGRAVWSLDPESMGMQINFPSDLFTATVDEGVVIIERAHEGGSGAEAPFPTVSS